MIDSFHPKTSVVESKAFQMYFMIPLVLLSIFLYDSWIISNPSDDANNAMNGTLIGIAAVFFLEILYYFYYERSYRTSKFIILDVASCISLLLDLSWVDPGITHSTSYLGETRAVKLFARYGRIIRLVKLGRHFITDVLGVNHNDHHGHRLSNSQHLHHPSTGSLTPSGSADQDMHGAHNRSRAGSHHLGLSTRSSFNEGLLMDTLTGQHALPSPSVATANASSSAKHVYAVSKASYELSRRLTERVSFIVAIIACVAPYLMYHTSDQSVNAWMTNFQYLSTSSQVLTTADFQAVADDMYNFYSNKDIRLLQVYISGPIPALNPAFSSSYQPSRSVIRAANIGYYSLQYSSSNVVYNIKVTMDQTYPIIMSSVYFIVLALVVMILLLYFTVSFQPTLNKHLVWPLTKMIISLKESANQIMKNVRAMSKHFGSLNDEGDDDSDDDDDDESEIDTDEPDESVHEIHDADTATSQALLYDKDYSSSLWAKDAAAETGDGVSSKSGRGSVKSVLSRVRFSAVRSKSLSKMLSLTASGGSTGGASTGAGSVSSGLRVSRTKSRSRLSVASDDSDEFREIYGNEHREVDMTRKMAKMVEKCMYIYNVS